MPVPIKKGVEMSEYIPQWWEQFDFSSIDGCSPLDESVALHGLFYSAIVNGKTLYRESINRNLDGNTFEELRQNLQPLLDTHNFRLVTKRLNEKEKNKPHAFFFEVYFSPNAMMVLSYDGDSTVACQLAAIDENVLQALADYVKDNTTDQPVANRVYVMACDSDDGIDFQSIGSAAVQFEPGNYMEEVCKDYRHVVEDLKSYSPCGRVVVLNGAPGTGKTFLVRGLMHDCPDAAFVMIQASMIEHLSDPNILPSIVQFYATLVGGPIVFVIEDADNAMATRMADNMSAVSSLLNLGDGILGSMLDIRIVATTNATVEDLDPALVRPGRLCRRIDVGTIGNEQAAAIYTRLTGKTQKMTSMRYTLAEVYSMARNGGWTAPKREKSLGFSMRPGILR